MIKVCILDRCEFCERKTNIFDCEDVDSRGEEYDRYRECEMCHGSDNRAKGDNLREFANLLKRAIAMEHRGIEVGCSVLLGFVIMLHNDDYFSLFVPFSNAAVSPDNLFQLIASIYDRFLLSRINKLFEENQNFSLFLSYPVMN